MPYPGLRPDAVDWIEWLMHVLRETCKTRIKLIHKTLGPDEIDREHTEWKNGFAQIFFLQICRKYVNIEE